MMLVVLSHPLGPDAPNWPGVPANAEREAK